jgi:chromosome segregation ATPase
LNHQGMSQTEKDGEMEQLRAKLVEADAEMKKAEKAWQEREAKSEQTLIDYKRKAQNSLSMANSRTASAVQAREEAEMDARAARATADSAFDRATKAEIASREAVAMAKASVQAKQDERDAAVAELQRVQTNLREGEEKLAKVQQKLEQAMASKENKALEIERMLAERATDQKAMLSLQQQIADLTRQNNIAKGDIESLRDELNHAKAAADASHSKAQTEDERATSLNGGSLRGDESSVSTLRQELHEANEAIEDLKAALANAVEMSERHGQTSDGGALPFDDSERSSAPVRSNGGGESIPLFYAMEKQAELKTARTEMNRLASVLADVQSEKTEAYEKMEEMKRRMEDAEARLKRFEKLGSAPAGLTATLNGAAPTNDSGAVNIEYLKHIMLRFLNAKTVTERKGLVPVIGAVLELTPNELSAAVQNVEQSAGVGSAIFGFLS